MTSPRGSIWRPTTDSAIPPVQPHHSARRHQQLVHFGVREYPRVTDVPGFVGKILLEGDRAVLTQAREYLLAQSWSGEYEIIFSGECLLEVTARGSNKGGMVRRLAQHLGISMDHVYCVGDETNDISMLTAAAEGFAPASCVDAVRRGGVTIVSDTTHDHQADVVDLLDRKYCCPIQNAPFPTEYPSGKFLLCKSIAKNQDAPFSRPHQGGTENDAQKLHALWLLPMIVVRRHEIFLPKPLDKLE